MPQKLLVRLTYHIKKRTEEKRKQDCWCLEWFTINMAIEKDINCLDYAETLLDRADRRGFAGDEKFIGKQETYLYFDENNSVWNLSLKVTFRKDLMSIIKRQVQD